MAQDQPTIRQAQQPPKSSRRRPHHHRRLRPRLTIDDDNFDWANYCNLRSRNSADDLRALLARAGDKPKLKFILERADKTGLSPVHWAAINNRSDFLDLLISTHECSARKACNNRLLSNGSPLHLAAMNGALEAAATLFDCAKDDPTILSIRDADGQTVLMRSASPKSRRINLLLDLLRKNFWSLNSRPAEMALFLIGRGADWRETEPKQGMNLLHLAIVNNHEDIVNLLLVIDVQLVEIPIEFKQPTPRNDSAEMKRVDAENQVSLEKTNSRDPLLGDPFDGVIEDIQTRGLKPLDLAILYRRVGIINLLWSLSSKRHNRLDQLEDGENRNKETEERMKWSLIKSCFTNKDELVRFLKPLLFRAALAIDFSAYCLIWVPVSSVHQHAVDRFMFSSFILSVIITLAMALRVAMKDPGYLQSNSVQYLSEMSQLLARRPKNSQSTDEEDKETKSFTREENPVDLLRSSGKQMIVQQPSKDDKGSKKNVTRICVPNLDENQNKESNSQAIRLGHRNSKLSERVRLLCHKCRCIRRPRSKHCDQCNQCVQDFDHHCIYLGCCIGRHNRLDFLIFLFLLAASSTYGTVFFLASSNSHGGISSPIWRFVGFIWVFKYVLIGGIKAFVIARRACLGVTMYEEIRAKRIKDGLGQTAIDSLKQRQFWRFPANKFKVGDLSFKQISSNFHEFANYNNPDEYILGLVSADTPLTRSLIGAKKARINVYKFV